MPATPNLPRNPSCPPAQGSVSSLIPPSQSLSCHMALAQMLLFPCPGKQRLPKVLGLSSHGTSWRPPSLTTQSEFCLHHALSQHPLLALHSTSRSLSNRLPKHGVSCLFNSPWSRQHRAQCPAQQPMSTIASPTVRSLRTRCQVPGHGCGLVLTKPPGSSHSCAHFTCENRARGSVQGCTGRTHGVGGHSGSTHGARSPLTGCSTYCAEPGGRTRDHAEGAQAT